VNDKSETDAVAAGDSKPLIEAANSLPETGNSGPDDGEASGSSVPVPDPDLGDGGSQGPVEPAPEPDGDRSETKSRSRLNATTHGAYAIEAIDFGPLKEDREEVLAFYRGVDVDLVPGASTLLRAQAQEVANFQWKLWRLRKWETMAYEVTEDYLGVYEPDRHARLAESQEFAARIIESLEDPDVTRDDLRRAFVILVELTLDRDDEFVYFVEHLQLRSTVMGKLRDFISENCNGTERAIGRLRWEASNHRSLEQSIRSGDSGRAARREISSDFTRSLLDTIARTSRELDRAIVRYQFSKELLKTMS